MRYRITNWYYYWTKYILRSKFSKACGNASFAGHQFLNPDEVNLFLTEKISSGIPFMACRIGANESFTLRTFEFKHKKNYKKALDQLCICAGFFPNSYDDAYKFVDVMKKSMSTMDLCGTLLCPFDDYFISAYAPNGCRTSLLDSIDSTARIYPWTSMLEGKRILIVHPFSKTIQQQYAKREFLFPGRNVLPAFELLTFQAVQTSAGQFDSRFHNWFEALDYMTNEIAKLEFDIALLGCGAYGLPLASRIKEMGRQAVQIGGSLQILFGIKGKRWDNDPETVKFYNSAWVYPLEEETPAGAVHVENACYWK